MGMDDEKLKEKNSKVLFWEGCHILPGMLHGSQYVTAGRAGHTKRRDV